jgi:acyl-homoserine-lactone acylase
MKQRHPVRARRLGHRLGELGILLLFAGCSSHPADAPRTEILWDTWGVPHIAAASEVDAARAFGWAQMESHGDLVLRLYGEARGRAAEYWGEEHLEQDRWIRTVGIPERAAEWHALQSERFRPLVDAFAEGINGWAAAHPDRVPEELGRVLPVTGIDVLAHSLRGVHFTFIANPGVVSSAQRRGPSAGLYDRSANTVMTTGMIKPS